jgi:hypothetical protein
MMAFVRTTERFVAVAPDGSGPTLGRPSGVFIAAHPSFL